MIRAVSTAFHGQGRSTQPSPLHGAAGPDALPHVGHFGLHLPAGVALLTLSISGPLAQQAYAAVPAYRWVLPFQAHENV